MTWLEIYHYYPTLYLSPISFPLFPLPPLLPLFSPLFLPFHRSLSLPLFSLTSQYLGKTHNLWYSAALMLEERAYSEGELPSKSREPPAYDGSYSDEILNPLKHVRCIVCTYNLTKIM